MLNKSGVVVILALVLIIEENFWFVNTEYISCGLVKYGLYYVEVPSYHTQFDDSFYHERVINCDKYFLCIYWYDHVTFILSFYKCGIAD